MSLLTVSLWYMCAVLTRLLTYCGYLDLTKWCFAHYSFSPLTNYIHFTLFCRFVQNCWFITACSRDIMKQTWLINNRIGINGGQNDMWFCAADFSLSSGYLSVSFLFVVFFAPLMFRRTVWTNSNTVNWQNNHLVKHLSCCYCRKLGLC